MSDHAESGANGRKRRAPKLPAYDRLVKVASHPVRARVLETLRERAASPKQLAAEFGVPLPNVSYHMRILAEAGSIELVATNPRRGALEHFYRATPTPELSAGGWAALAPNRRRTIAGRAIERLASAAGIAIDEGRFDEDDARAVWIEMPVDQTTRAELAELLTKFEADLQQLNAKAVQRLSKQPASTDAPKCARLALFRYGSS